MVIDDYSALKDLWRECGLSDEPEDRKEDVEAMLNSIQGTGFVALDDSRVIGAVLCGSDGRYGYIHHLAVTRVSRRQGIGKSLVESCFRFLNRRHVIIMVRESNALGNEFWKRLKFQKADWLNVQFIEPVSQVN